MVTFWSFTAVLLVVALLFIWLPFFTRRAAPVEAPALSADTERVDLDRNAQNIAIFKSRLAELQKELDDNNLDADTFIGLKTELEQNLLDEVDDQQQSNRRTDLAWWIPTTLTAILPVVALMLYLQWGASQQLMVREASVIVQGQQGAQDIDSQIASLKAHLEKEPNNPEGWVMLARTYMTLERFQEAYAAFASLTKHVGESPQIISQQAQALYLLNNRRATPEVQALFERALALDPKDPGTLGMLGLVAYESGRYQDAIDFWQKALENNNPDVNREGLVSAIGQAKSEQARLGLAKDGTPVKDATANAAEAPMPDRGDVAYAELKIAVDLSAELRAQVADTTTVFVLAQAVQGPKMPLAVSRLQVKDLPVIVTLNDQMAMGPMAKLSSVDQVMIRALISHAGTAAATPGDFYGIQGPIAVMASTEVISLSINKIIE